MRDVHLGEGAVGTEVLLPPGHEVGAPAIGRYGFRQHGHDISSDVAAVHDHHARLGLLICRDTDALLKFGCHISVTIDYHESMIAKHKEKNKKNVQKKIIDAKKRKTQKINRKQLKKENTKRKQKDKKERYDRARTERRGKTLHGRTNKIAEKDLELNWNNK